MIIKVYEKEGTAVEQLTNINLQGMTPLPSAYLVLYLTYSTHQIKLAIRMPNFLHLELASSFSA